MKIFYACLVIVALASVLLAPYSALAQNAPATGFESICSKTGGIAVCIKKIYLFSLGFGALLALMMLVLSGYRYITAAGNAEQVQNAKDQFEEAFKGLIIIFVAFILLYIINPDLVQFKKLEFPTVNTQTR